MRSQAPASTMPWRFLQLRRSPVPFQTSRGATSTRNGLPAQRSAFVLALVAGALLTACTSASGGGGHDSGGFNADAFGTDLANRKIQLVQPVEWCYGASAVLSVVAEGPCFIRHEGKCELCPGPLTANAIYDGTAEFAPIRLYCKNAKKDCDASCWYPPDRTCVDLHP